ncbi:hypothetical protein ACFVT2_01000 [Streptomyces sp. NPDC058000]|uniref:hypothetical protein n=1 Tax=Streptomyces sp. NPDC058000 TaxID=3346299 RepID=UPI0036E659D3
MRIRRTYRPRPALILTDTPRPDCWACNGDGGHTCHSVHLATGTYTGSHWAPCLCWDNTRRWRLLPLPRALLRTPPGSYSNEPPF